MWHKQQQQQRSSDLRLPRRSTTHPLRREPRRGCGPVALDHALSCWRPEAWDWLGVVQADRHVGGLGEHDAATSPGVDERRGAQAPSAGGGPIQDRRLGRGSPHGC